MASTLISALVSTPHFVLQKDERTRFHLRMPMPIGQEAGFTKEEAIELAKTHPDYDLHFSEEVAHVNLDLTPGYKAILKYTMAKPEKKKAKFNSYRTKFKEEAGSL